jgi:AcrR family transcriptional regulator
VERILEAAGHVFAEKSFDAATTEEIAERAGVSIGSVYQYFPNKDALFEAIADQYLARARAVFELHMTAAAIEGGTWEEVIDRAIDAFDYLQRTEIGGRAVWLNWARSARFFAKGAELNTEFAHQAEGVLAIYAPALAPKERLLVATTIVEVISSMLFVAVRTGGDLGRQLVEETKVLLRRYLAPLATPTVAAPPPAAARGRATTSSGRRGGGGAT